MRVKLLFVSNCFFGSTFDDPWLKKFLAYKFNPKHTKAHLKNVIPFKEYFFLEKFLHSVIEVEKI